MELATDKNHRPYLISLDWLSLSIEVTPFFLGEGTNQWGYRFDKKQYGSKMWRDIYDVYDPENVLVATLACHPHNEQLKQSFGTLKIDNALLYADEAIDHVAAIIKCCGLRYRGISRVDIAYDCNEFYGGLRPDNLVRRYIDGKYVKAGQNKFMLVGSAGYYGVRFPKGQEIELWTEKPNFLKTDAEFKAEQKELQKQSKSLEAAGLPPVKPKNIGRVARPHLEFGSITWGFRSNQVQVQIYDKSKELKDVSFKKYIWDSWQLAGLDVTKPIYRTEIRVQNQGKAYINTTSGSHALLQLQDFILQEQVEQIFFDYAEKYCCFHRFTDAQVCDPVRHKERMPRVKLFSLTNQKIIRPKRASFSRELTRSVKITAKQIAREISELQRNNSKEADVLKQSLNYFDRVYSMRDYLQDWMSKELYLQGLQVEEGKRLTPEEYFKERLKGAPDEEINRFAKALTALENKVTAYAEHAACVQKDAPVDSQMLIDFMQFPTLPAYKKTPVTQDIDDFSQLPTIFEH